MPAIKSLTGHATDLDLDVAQLGDPIADDALDLLSTIIEIRDDVAELTMLIEKAQRLLEQNVPAFAVTEQIGADLAGLAEKISEATAWTVG